MYIRVYKMMIGYMASIEGIHCCIAVDDDRLKAISKAIDLAESYNNLGKDPAVTFKTLPKLSFSSNRPKVKSKYVPILPGEEE